jgi:hypothetical protein
MPSDPRLIIQVPRGGAVERQLHGNPPPSAAGDDVVLDSRPADENGRLEPVDVGHVVLSVPSPETLTREPENVRRVIDGAGPGVEPLVVVVEAAEELREDELAVVLDAAGRTKRPVVLRVVGDA